MDDSTSAICPRPQIHVLTLRRSGVISSFVASFSSFSFLISLHAIMMIHSNRIRIAIAHTMMITANEMTTANRKHFTIMA